jgi:predicted nucleic acid-binding protein
MTNEPTIGFPRLPDTMAKCIFVDSDVLIDVFSKREPFYNDSAYFLEMAENKVFLAFTSPLIVANVYYVLQRFSAKETAMASIRKIRTFMGIVDMNQRIVDRAINSSFPDFEDALQIYSAENAVMDIIVTRNILHLKDSNLSVMKPLEAISLLEK